MNIMVGAGVIVGAGKVPHSGKQLALSVGTRRTRIR